MAEMRDRAIEALRTESGLTLVVWPARGRRATLSDGRRLADLGDTELAALLEGSSPLTVTETVIEFGGAAWLVQQTGPAWAEPAEASADLCGLSFLRLDGTEHREILSGRSPGPLPSSEELSASLADALEPGEAPAEDA
jgi:hypothetical protein